jgi:hypothetical protein
MALPDLTGLNIEETYQRLLQTDGVDIYDGTGSLFLPSASLNITGSLFGTASYALTASYAVSASYEINYETSSSYADYAVSASYALTASYVENAQTASYVLNAVSASYSISSSLAETASFYNETDPVFVAKSASLTTTGSNTFIGDQIITGSLDVSFGITGSLLGTATTASYVLNAVSASYSSTASFIDIINGGTF